MSPAVLLLCSCSTEAVPVVVVREGLLPPVVLPNGDTYTGHWRNDKPHGRGTLAFADPMATRLAAVKQAFPHKQLSRPAMSDTPVSLTGVFIDGKEPSGLDSNNSSSNDSNEDVSQS